MRDECLKVRRGVETTPNGFRLAPFDATATQRITWLQRQVITPIETLQEALDANNAPNFHHWEQYGETAAIADDALLNALENLKELASKIRGVLEGEVKRHVFEDKISHTSEIRFYVVHECLWELRKCYPDFKITRGNWDKELGKTIGTVPEYVRRIFRETTGQHEQLDGQIQEVLKSL